LAGNFNGFVEEQGIDSARLLAAARGLVIRAESSGAGRSREGQAGAENCASRHHLRLLPIRLIETDWSLDVAVTLNE
jgi:hypothetical protein